MNKYMDTKINFKRNEPMKKTLNILLSAFLTLLFTLQGSNAQPLDTIAAVVNDDVILTSEVNDLVKQLKGMPDFADKSQKAVIKEAMDSLILTTLQTQRAKQLGLNIDDFTVNKALAKIAERNKLNATQFKEALANEGIDYLSFRERIRTQILINELRKQYQRQSSNTSESSINDVIANSSDSLIQNRSYQYYDLLVPAPPTTELPELRKIKEKAHMLRNSIINGQAIATTPGVKQLTANTQNRPTKTIIVQLAKLEVGQTSPVIHDSAGFHILQLTDKKGETVIKTPQEMLVRHILIKVDKKTTSEQALQKITEIRNKIVAGTSFNVMANQFSDDPGSGSQGGELGWATADTYVPEFAQTITSIKNKTLSEPFKTKFGWHILEVLDRREGIADAQAILQAQARQVLSNNTDKKGAYQNWLKELRSNAHIEYRVKL